jgi:hypothetical protein
MTSHYFSRLVRKQPTPGATPFPTAAEVAAILRGRRQADGSYMYRCPCGLHKHATALLPCLSKTGVTAALCCSAAPAATIAMYATRSCVSASCL